MNKNSAIQAEIALNITLHVTSSGQIGRYYQKLYGDAYCLPWVSKLKIG